MDFDEEDDLLNFIDIRLLSPCDNCNYKAECSFECKFKICEKRLNIKFKAERIA